MHDKEDDISRQFYNSETQAPFESCLVCGKHLGSGEEHFVERIFRRVPAMDIVETLFEYAMCLDCAAQLRKQMSTESLGNMEAFFNERLRDNDGFLSLPPGQRLSVCMITGKDITGCSEFSFHGHFRDGKAVTSFFPFAMSDEAMEQISALLSAQTLEELDNFKGKYFTGPPEVSRLINSRRFVPL